MYKFIALFLLMISTCVNADDSALRFSCLDKVPPGYSELNFGDYNELFRKTYICIEKLKDVKTVNMVKRRPLMKEMGDGSTYLTKVDPIDLSNTGGYLTPLTSFGFLPGEKIAFDWKAGKYSGTFEMIPNPLHFESEDGSLAVDIELQSGGLFLFKFKGFKKGENVKFTSISAKEVMNHEFAYNASNPFYYSPAVIGLKGGVAKIIFKTDSATVKIDLPWGEEIAKQMLEQIKIADNWKKTLKSF